MIALTLATRPPSQRIRGTLRSLYICYLSVEDPLVHTQVVAYLAGLAAEGHTVHLLTFDPKLRPERREEVAQQLRAAGVEWHSLRYHKRPSLPATVYDALRGVVTATRLVRRHNLEALHARNHVPLATALIVRRLTGSRLIFDIRGLMAEEYADAGRWKEGGLAYRLTQAMQRAGLRRADGVVTLTEAVRSHLFGPNGRPRAHVIPCCADLDRLEAQLDQRHEVRRELGVADRVVMIYVGKFTGWYMERQMVDFFAAARRVEPKLLFLILTQGDRGVIEREFSRAGVSPSDFMITQAPPDEVGRYLAAADFGISLIRRCFSKISSSPTKIGEYLGAGLPVLSSAGIGDVDALLDGDRVGVLLDDFTDSGYDEAAAEVLELAGSDGIGARCRSVAHRRLSLREVGIPRYDELYRDVAELS
jgi:glycosyltransferase involved in cell wall biosynthesis